MQKRLLVIFDSRVSLIFRVCEVNKIRVNEGVETEVRFGSVLLYPYAMVLITYWQFKCLYQKRLHVTIWQQYDILIYAKHNAHIMPWNWSCKEMSMFEGEDQLEVLKKNLKEEQWKYLALPTVCLIYYYFRKLYFWSTIIWRNTCRFTACNCKL